MAADCSFFRSSMAFTTIYVKYCSVDGRGLLLFPLVKGFHHGLHAIFLRGCQQIAHSSTCQRLSRFAPRFAQRMAADCSFLRSTTAFPTACTPISSVDGSALLVHLLVNCFHGWRAVFLGGWQCIARSSTRQCLSWFAHCIAKQMAADCSFFRLSTAFTLCSPFCTGNGCGLLILALDNAFPDYLRADFLNGW